MVKLSSSRSVFSSFYLNLHDMKNILLCLEIFFLETYNLFEPLSAHECLLDGPLLSYRIDWHFLTKESIEC